MPPVHQYFYKKVRSVMHMIDQFLDEHFNRLELMPALFYEWPYGLRFEISHPTGDEELAQAFYRSTKLFNEVFDEKDQMGIVTNIYSSRGSTYLQRRPLNVYRKYIKSQKLRYKLQYQQLQGAWDKEDEEENLCHRFTLICQKRDIQYAQLLKAICYEDFAHPSTILKSDSRMGYDLYFINLTKKMIFHLYDDRGCDIIAADVISLKHLYLDYNEWILNYDRTAIDQVFG